MIPVRVFDIFVVVMFWSAAVIFGVAMALMEMLLLTRIRAIARRRRTRYLVTFWRKVFTGVARPAVRSIARRDAFTVLSLWNDFHRVRTETSAGVPQERLAEIARTYGLDRAAARLLLRGDTGDQLVALTFMTHFASPGQVENIAASSRSDYGEISLAAHQALVAIDPAYMSAFAQAIAQREDYRASTVEQAIGAIGPTVATPPIIELLSPQDPQGSIRLLRFFPMLEAAAARRAILHLLEGSPGADLAAAALRALRDLIEPQDRETVLPFLRHPVSFVRIAAIGALQPVCQTSDRETLLELLSDADSWVRYRAAQILVEHFTREGVEGDLRREVADRYARDALTQVLAERSVIALREFVAEETGEPGASGEQSLPLERRPIDEMRVHA